MGLIKWRFSARAENFTSVKGVEKSRIIGSLSSPAED